MIKKPNFSYPEPQELEPIMAITLSPEDIPNPRKVTLMDTSIKEYLAEMLTHIHYMLDDLKYSRIMVNYEMHGRPHWHGWIEIFDVPKFYIHDIPILKDYGHFDISVEKGKIENSKYTDWLDYCIKQSPIWSDLCPALMWVICPQPKKPTKNSNLSV